MSSPLVNTIIPCYNQEDFIEESILSAVNQDYDNLLVVVGDDGSKDKTLEVAKSLQQKYKERIFIVPDATHFGITPNFQRILNHCKGDFIAFHAGDDIQMPGKITKQVNWFKENPEAVLCGHDTLFFENSTNENLYLYSEKHFPLQVGKGFDYFDEVSCMYDALSIMIRSSAIPSFGFDSRISVCSDIKFWIDILKGERQYGFVDGVYTKHRLHDRNVTRSPMRSINELIAFKVISIDYPELKPICDEKIFYLLKHIGKSLDFKDPKVRKESKVKKTIKSIYRKLK